MGHCAYVLCLCTCTFCGFALHSQVTEDVTWNCVVKIDNDLNTCITACTRIALFIVVCSKLTAQQRALLRAFAETEKDVEGTVKTFEGKI